MDLFGGGGVITLNATACANRVYSDADWFKANLLRCVRDWPAELQGRLSGVSYSEETFQKSKALNAAHRVMPTLALKYDDAREELIDWAVHFLIRNRLSRGGLGNDFAWSDRLRGGLPGDLNAWRNAVAAIPRVSARLQGVEINCRHFREALKWMPAGRVCLYCDPPYVASTRTTPNAYEIEMSDGEHAELLAALIVKAREGCSVLVSGYANDLYDRMLVGWKRRKFSMPNHSGQGKTKQRRTEVLWSSPAGGM